MAPTVSDRATVFGLAACSEGDIAWLRSCFGPLSPPCVVVADLSVDCLQRLYPLRSPRLRVIWTDEGERRLIQVLEGFSTTHRPMWRLGWKLLSDYSLKPSVRATITRVCGLQDKDAGIPFVPENSVGRLADHVDLAPPTLRQYWRKEVPLRCSLKELLSWAVLLWALDARSRDGWKAIAAQVGLRRRTLQRNFIRLAGCTLAEAAEDPERVVGRFDAWVKSVWDPRAGNRLRKHDEAPPWTPVEPMS